MILLVDQVHKRTQFLNEYLDQITNSLSRRKYNQALKYISNQKSNIHHTNVSKYNPNTFLIDSLKAKNQKLHQTLAALQAQKQQQLKYIQQSVDNSGGVSTNLIEQKVLAVVSKIQITLKDSKKVEFQYISLNSDFQTLKITTFEGKHFTIYLNKVFFIEKKGYQLNIHTNQNNFSDNLFIIFKFDNQVSLNKWYNCFNYGKLYQQSKAKRYLFLPTRDKFDIQPMDSTKNPIKQKRIQSENSQVMFIGDNTISNAFKSTFNHDNSLKNKNFIPENPFQPNQRTYTGSFVNNQIKKSNPMYLTSYRPPNLNRVRGKSMYFEHNSGKNFLQYKRQKQQDQIIERNDFYLEKSKHPSKSSFRKASQDITLRPKKISQHEQKLQKFRSQRNLIDDILTQAHKGKKHGSINSKRIELQIQKKNQLLQRNRNMHKSVIFNNEPQNNWLQQNDEVISRSSRNNTQKSRFKEQHSYSLQQGPYTPTLQQGIDKFPNHGIQQVSQLYEMSPTFPTKIVYQDGSHIRLYPVENSMNGSGKLHQQTNLLRNSRANANNRASSNRLSSKHQSQQNQFVQPLQLQDNSENQQIQNSNIFRNQRINTLDSQTDKQHEFHESNSEDNFEQAFEQLLDQLKKGIVLTKCAQGSFWTRQKEVKLSQNQNTLLIVDVKDKKIKKTPISDIRSIQYSKFSKGIIKHITQIQEKKCFLMSVQEGKQIKKIQFYGNNPQKLQKFSNNLNYFVETFKAS